MKHKIQKVWQKLVLRYGKKGALLLAAIPIAMAIGGGGTYAALYIGSSGQGDVNLQQGLVGHWKLDGNGVDSSSYGNNGTVTGASVATDRKDSASGALSFNGTSSDYVTIGNPDEMQITGSQTISMWLKPDTFDIRRNPFAKAYGGEGTITQETSGTLNYYYGTNGGNGHPYQNINTGTSLSLDTWTHVLIVRDLDSMELTWYVNGSQTNQTTANYASAIASSNSAFIGRGYVNNYSGSIDDVRVYNRAINQAEVQALYSQYDSKLSIGDLNAGLVGHWKLDGNAKDATPYSNDGAVTGATSTTDRQDRANGAYEFDGSGDYIDTTNLSDELADIPNDDFTVSTWFRSPTNSSLPTAISFGVPENWSNDLFILYVGEGGDRGIRVWWDGSTRYTYGQHIASSDWQHVAMTRTADTIEIYLNGSSIGTGTAAGTWTSTSVTIGTANSNGSMVQRYTGKLDDMRVYNRALSVDEIQRLGKTYDSQISLYGGGGTTSGGSTGAGLVGYWPLDGNAKDATPYSNHGTVMGAFLAPNRFGQPNMAYEFDRDGTEKYISNLNLTTYSDSGALSFWIYGDPSLPTQARIFDRFHSPEIVYRPDGSMAVFWILDGYSGSDWSLFDMSVSVGTMPLGQWHHVVLQFNKSECLLKLHINNSLEETLDLDGFDPSRCTGIKAGGDMNLGWTSRFADSALVGRMDDVRLYNRALSDGEVQQLYNSN